MQLAMGTNFKDGLTQGCAKKSLKGGTELSSTVPRSSDITLGRRDGQISRRADKTKEPVPKGRVSTIPYFKANGKEKWKAP